MMQDDRGQSDDSLAHYRLVEVLGEGGMGVVWRAVDSRLDRQVAVKLLPETVAADPERLARFRREARVLAALNHTNIAAIYGLEEAGDRLGLILELAPGDTLAGRLADGPLPIEDTLRICHQIALALESAHSQGIVHRDLKPQNVKIGPDGQVKVLDFGLAKALAEESTPDMSRSPTLTRQVTHAGVILGTASYMSPEQARGKPVDKRSDIWSFGCLLYECLTGEQAFGGETVTDSLTSILYREPEWKLLPRNTPVAVQRLFRRCFQKDANQRLHDIADARIEIEEALAAYQSGTSSDLLLGAEVMPAPPEGRRLPLWLAGALALGVALGVAAGALLSRGPSGAPGDRGVVRFALGQPGLASSFPVIAPDGSTVAYVARDELLSGPAGGERLYTRRLDSYDARAVPNSDDVVAYTFSPDSRWLAFIAPFSGDSRSLRLVKAPVDGSSPPLAIADWPEDALPAVVWLSGNEIVGSIPEPASLWRIPADGGAGATTVELQGDFKGSLILIEPLPDGRTVLGAAGSYVDERLLWSVAALNADTGELKIVVEDGTIAAWSTTGHLLFTRRDTLLAVPFDPGRLETTGGPVAITGGLLTVDAQVGGWFDLSADGTLVFQPGGVQGNNRRLLTAHPDGRIAPWSDQRHALKGAPAVTPDGQRLAIARTNAEGLLEIWTADAAQRDLRRGVAEPGMDCRAPVWSTRGRHLFYFCAGEGDRGGVFVRDLEAGTDPDLVLPRGSSGVLLVPTSIASDGSLLLVERVAARREILALPLDEAGRPGAPSTLARDLSVEAGARLAPNGELVAFTSAASGRPEVYLLRLDGGRAVGSPVPVSTTGGSRPVWKPDLDTPPTLYYESAAGRLMAVTVGPGPRPAIDAPRQVLDLSDLRADGLGTAILNGGRIILLQRGAEEDGSSINVELNFHDEIRRHF